MCPTYLNITPNDCLVFTLGIADQWTFEDWIGQQGCEVHAFDPTIAYLDRHLAHKSDNVIFHYEGLKGNSSTVSAESHVSSYGKLGGEFYTLNELWKKYGNNRKINMIKIDCEGCEWESFVDAARFYPEALENTCTIVIEVHVVKSLQMRTIKQLIQMSEFWRLFIEVLGFRLWYLHKNPGGPVDRVVNPILIQLGLEPDICCYEIALYRPGCAF